MKEKLDSESRAAIVNYRLERAYETLKEADYNRHCPKFCVNGNRIQL